MTTAAMGGTSGTFRRTQLRGTRSVLLVDDHSIFRAGVARLLEDERTVAAVVQAGDADAAMRLLTERRFDVVILDINLPGRSGLDLIPTMRAMRPEVPILVLSMYPARQYALLAYDAGAVGYVSKDMEAEELLAAIDRVIEGGRYIPPEAAERMLESLDAAPGEDKHVHLSPREDTVMRAIVAGTPMGHIATDMGLSVKTVSTYRTRVFRKLGIESNAELVRYAMRRGLVS